MAGIHRLALVCILLGATVTQAADPPAPKSTLPAVQTPAPGTPSRAPATGPVAPGAPAASGAIAAQAMPLKCTVSIEQSAPSKWGGGGGTFRVYKVTNSLGGRQAIPAGSKIKWSAPNTGFGDGGEHVLAAALLPGQSVGVGSGTNPKPTVDPKSLMKGSSATPQPTCEAKLMP